LNQKLVNKIRLQYKNLSQELDQFEHKDQINQYVLSLSGIKEELSNNKKDKEWVEDNLKEIDVLNKYYGNPSKEEIKETGLRIKSQLNHILVHLGVDPYEEYISKKESTPGSILIYNNQSNSQRLENNINIETTKFIADLNEELSKRKPDMKKVGSMISSFLTKSGLLPEAIDAILRAFGFTFGSK